MKSKILKTILFVMVVLGALYMQKSPLVDSKFNFPGYQQMSDAYTPVPCDNDASSMLDTCYEENKLSRGCTTENFEPAGFPFKVNGYSACGNDSKIRWELLGFNIIIIAGIPWAFYIVITSYKRS